MYSNDREAYRKIFYIAWQKYQKNLPLEPAETQLVDVILFHPEYHVLLNNENESHQEFTIEENPFLHMSLHIALREQVELDRPIGIKNIYQRLLLTHKHEHAVEHLMTTCLARVLWEAQNTGVAPDEADYLEKLGELT